jgi:colanic acid/amylovoran biosynthesis glycosyltransferase
MGDQPMSFSPVPRYPDTPLRIVFIVSKFPCYDEAFILREIYALSKEKDIRIFSLRPSREEVVHDQARELLPKTVYVPYLLSWGILKANAVMLGKNPLCYLAALGRLIFGNLKSPNFLLKSLAFFPKAVYLAHWMKQEGVNFMHAYWATYPASVALVASEISGVPFSFTGHAHDIYLDTTHLKEKIRYAKFVSTCTSSNKDYLRKIAPSEPADKIFLNYHGLDLEKFDSNGKTRNNVFQILSVGTLQTHKGFSYLLNALDLLQKKGLKFHCTIIGGGPLEEDLRRHIQMLHLEEQVTMTGALKQAQVIPYHKKADLHILLAQPEWHWGIPNVLIEALAAKAAVMTTSFGSVEELVQDGVTGLIVPPKDPVKVAAAIEKLYTDDAYRLQLIEAGHRLVASNFDLKKKMQEFVRRMEEAVCSTQ